MWDVAVHKIGNGKCVKDECQQGFILTIKFTISNMWTEGFRSQI